MAGSCLTPGTEDEFVRSLTRGLPTEKNIVIGPGDDCAAVRVRRLTDLLLLKTDCVVEGVHFEAGFSPLRVGRKAINRVLSDIAAMGGRPAQALVTVLTTREKPASFWRKVYSGMRGAATPHGLLIVGGETSCAPVVAISVAATGFVAPSEVVSRSGGRSGDLLFVTGRLGGSLARRHWAFSPRLPEGQWLARNGFARAMMDLSDGLAADLPRLANASGCGFSVNPATVPVARGHELEAAYCDGEDYELLFACSPSKAPLLAKKWKAKFPGLELSEIGKLTPRGRGADFGIPLRGGYDHFAPHPGMPSKSPPDTKPRRL